MPPVLTTTELSLALGQAVTAVTLPEKVKDALRLMAVAGVKQNFSKSQAPDGTAWKPLAFKRPQGGNKPLRNTGKLMSSLVGSWQGDTLFVTASSPGALLHNFGGTVKAKSGKALAIPLTKEAARVDGPRHFGLPLHIERRKGSPSALLVENPKGKQKRGTAHFLLVKQVKVPQREYLGLTTDVQEKMARLVSEAIVKEILKGVTRADG